MDDEDEYNAIQEQLNEAKKPSAGAKLAQQKEVFFNMINTEQIVYISLVKFPFLGAATFGTANNG